MFLDISIIIGNVIDIYVFGVVAICMNGYIYAYYLGSLLFSFMWYFRVLGYDYSLLLLPLIEFSTLLFQSLTLSNRISINIVAGCLLSYLVGLLSSFHFIFSLLNYSIYIFILLKSTATELCFSLLLYLHYFIF